ncbi:unnamed protein product [Plutella xylostella]|uniref:(diamondback moth) hypothetical protein n=1 Tax=Plutella xylostella TaxID=51655 RepID=A0A8S4D1E7_PLUXY|nr:unnamed protein product [Plutella xylostella]
MFERPRGINNRYADSAADKKPLSRSMSRPDVRKKKSEDFDDDLPLPPE